MSKYTTMLRWIVEQEQGKVPASSSTRYTKATYKKLGLNEYPLFDESYRSHLNDKIIDHFYFREIGFETAAQFAWYMRRTMNEIMPYYNEMYVAQAKMDDPLTDISRNWRESWNQDIADTGNVKNQVNSTDNNRNVYQDTPMSLLKNSGHPSIEGLDYATNATYNDDVAKSDSTRTMDTNRNDVGWRVHEESGRNHSQAALMKEYFDVFKNLDMEVIKDLENLFMGLW